MARDKESKGAADGTRLWYGCSWFAGSARVHAGAACDSEGDRQMAKGIELCGKGSHPVVRDSPW